METGKEIIMKLQELKDRSRVWSPGHLGNGRMLASGSLDKFIKRDMGKQAQSFCSLHSSAQILGIILFALSRTGKSSLET